MLQTLGTTAELLCVLLLLLLLLLLVVVLLVVARGDGRERWEVRLRRGLIVGVEVDVGGIGACAEEKTGV